MGGTEPGLYRWVWRWWQQSRNPLALLNHSRYTQVVSEEASCRSWDALLQFHALRSSLRREWGGKPWTWYRYPIGEAWSRTPFKGGGGGCHVREGMRCRTGLRESGSRGCYWVLL